MVQICRALLLLCSKRVGIGEDGRGISLLYPYLYLLLWVRNRKLCLHDVDFYLTVGFSSMKSWRDSCGAVVFYVIKSGVFLSMRCVTVEGSEVVARVLCVGGKRLTPWRCQDKPVTRVGVACGCLM